MKNCNFSTFSPSYHQHGETSRPKNMKRILTLTVFTFFAFAALSVQAANPKVRGVVKDGRGNPVAFSTVMFAPLSDTLAMRGEIANEQGYFDIPAGVGEHRIVVSMLGYESYRTTVTLSEDTDLGEIVLTDATVEMDAVTVRADMIRRRADGYVFNPAGSPIVTGRTSLELLNFAPGVWYSRDNGISINGKTGTKVMVNDRMINLSGEELAAYLESIDAEQIRTIEVIPETGAQYDADSGGGILKITLKRSSTAGLTGSVSMNFDLRDDEPVARLRPGFNLEYRKDRLSIYGSGSYQKSNGMERDHEYTQYLTGDRREIDSDVYFDFMSRGYDARIGSVYELTDRQSVGLDFNFWHGRNDEDGTAISTIRSTDYSADAASYYGNGSLSERYGLSFNYKLKTDAKGSQLTVVADYMRNENTNDESNLSTETPSAGTPLRTRRLTDRISGTDLYTMRFDYKHYLSTQYQLETGAKYAYTDMDTDIRYRDEIDGVLVPNEALNDHYLYREGVLAGYVNATADLGRWNLTAGLRAENTDLRPHSFVNPDRTKNQNYTDLFPTVRAAYFIDKEKGHMVSAGYSRRIRRPSFSQLNPFRIQMNNYTYIVGNPDMKPSYTDSYTLTGTFANKYTLSLGFQDQRGAVFQIVIPDPDDPNILLYQQANIDRISSYFASLSAPFTPAKWWWLNVDATYVYQKNKLSTYELNKGMFQGRINNVFTGPKNWGAELSWFYMSGATQGNMRIGSYDFLNASLRKGFFDNRLTASFFVNNILDGGSYLMSATIEDQAFTKRLQLRNSGNPTRTYGLSLRWNFKAGKEVRVQKVTAGNSEERER